MPPPDDGVNEIAGDKGLRKTEQCPRENQSGAEQASLPMTADKRIDMPQVAPDIRR